MTRVNDFLTVKIPSHDVFVYVDVGSWIMLGTRNVCVVLRQGLRNILGTGIVPGKSCFSSPNLKTPCFPSYIMYSWFLPLCKEYVINMLTLALNSLFHFFVDVPMYVGVGSWILLVKWSVCIVKSQTQVPRNIVGIGVVPSKSLFFFLLFPSFLARLKFLVSCITACRCDFYNYARNMACLKCNAERPKEQPTVDYEDHEWRRSNWLGEKTPSGYII